MKARTFGRSGRKIFYEEVQYTFILGRTSGCCLNNTIYINATEIQ
jgi:hypothetical protein